MKRTLLALALVVGAALPAQARVPFDIGFTVRTAHATNVVVRWKVRCSTDHWQTFAQDSGQFEAITPVVQTVPQTLDDATSCHIRVVAWDVKPWHATHHGQRPVVTTWVR
jgi:hypothetical protein